MVEVFSTMNTYFSDSKLAGSYFMLFLVSIFLMYYLDKDKHKWFILYGIALLVVVVMNPFTVWILSKAFPALAIYGPFTILIPTLLYIPFTITELVDKFKTSKYRHLLWVALIFLICICGNLFGHYSKNTINDTNRYDDEKREIVSYLNEKQPELVLADETIVPFITDSGENVPMLYGKDMWTYGLDMGIMDSYTEEEVRLYHAMEDAKLKADYIADTAQEFGCDIIVVKRYDDAAAYIGNYIMAKQTENYLIYEAE